MTSNKGIETLMTSNECNVLATYMTSNDCDVLATYMTETLVTSKELVPRC